MAATTTTTAAAVIEKIVSPRVQETLIQESVMIPAVDNRSAEVGSGMDRLDVSRFTALTPGDITEGSTLASTSPTISVDQLALDKNKGIHWELTDLSTIQSKVSLNQQIFGDAGKEMAAQVDSDIIAELKANVSAAAPDHRIQMTGTGNIELTQADITNAQKLLNDSRVPRSDRFLLVRPEQERVMLNISDFIRSDTYGDSRGLQNGELGRIYGLTVIMTTSSQLAEDEALFFHRSAVAYASQASLKFDQSRVAGEFSDHFALSMVYGVKTLDSGKRAVLYNDDGL